MLPACNKGVGMNMGFPDVCLTPAGPAPVPIPYPNMAMNAMAVPFLPTILLSCMPALNMMSKIPMTLGDQPGVAHPVFMQMGAYTMGVPTILLQGLPAVTLTSPTTGNAMNNPIGMVAVPSVTNVLFARALAAGPRDAVGLDGVREIADAMSPGARHAGGNPESPGPAVEVADLPGGVAHVRVRAFPTGVASQVYAELQRRHPAALVIDLRGNRGGELRSFLAFAADFLPRGSELCTVVDGDGDTEVHHAPHDRLYDLPVAVIVDHGTASAAELFAGCLQAHGRATIVGEPTTGKATAHQVVPCEGRAAYLTAARCLLPGAVDLQGKGVLPDVPVAFDAPDTDALGVAAGLFAGA